MVPLAFPLNLTFSLREKEYGGGQGVVGGMVFRWVRLDIGVVDAVVPLAFPLNASTSSTHA